MGRRSQEREGKGEKESAGGYTRSVNETVVTKNWLIGQYSLDVG